MVSMYVVHFSLGDALREQVLALILSFNIALLPVAEDNVRLA